MINRTSSVLTLVFASAFLISIGFLMHNAFADQIIATIPVGPSGFSGQPSYFGAAVNPNTNRVYVGGYAGVVVLDGSTNNIVDRIADANGTFNGGGTLIDVDPIADRIYEGKYIIDGHTDQVIGTIQAGTSWGLTDIKVNPVTDEFYAARSTNYCHQCAVGWVDIGNSTDGSLITSIHEGGWLNAVAINPSTNKIYYSGQNSGYIWEIDGATNTVVDQIPADLGVVNLAVNPVTDRLYAGSQGIVYVFDLATNSLVTQIPVRTGNFSFASVAVNPTTNKIYAASFPYLGGTGTVYVIDGSTNTPIQNFTVGADPGGMAVNPNTNRIYVVNQGSGTVSVIDGSTRQLQVNSQDSYGNDLPGYYTKLYAPDGTLIDSGYTPYNFTLETGQNYTVHVGNYGNYKFNHWLDTNSTNASRAISITSDTSITAVYATIPTHPSNLTATAVSPSEIDLSWNAPSSDGGSPVTAYRIQISTDDSTWTTIVKNTGNTNTTYSGTGLSADTTYYYRVFALNSVGSSYRSNVASATTPMLAVAGTNVGP